MMDDWSNEAISEKLVMFYQNKKCQSQSKHDARCQLCAFYLDFTAPGTWIFDSSTCIAVVILAAITTLWHFTLVCAQI
jgi:hypothetical protein